LTLPSNSSFLEQLLKMATSRCAPDAKLMAALLEAVALHQQISETSFGASESVELAEFAYFHFDRHLRVRALAVPGFEDMFRTERRSRIKGLLPDGRGMVSATDLSSEFPS